MQRPLLRAFLVASALLPLVITVPRVVAGMRGACLASDFALLELSTGEAAQGAQWLGPYSRFGWRHPGPAYFYLLAPLYRLSGGTSASLPVGALIINWAAVLAMMLMLWRHADRPETFVLALVLALAYGAYLGPGFVYNIWNPAITVLPFGLLLLSCAAVACGESRGLPVLAVIGSFLVQTHVGYLPPVAVAIAVALGLRARGRQHGDIAPAPLTTVALTLGALVLLWTLPVIEQLTRTPGNLTRMALFFLRGQQGHSLREALAVVSREIAWPWSYLLFGARDQYATYPALAGARLAGAAALTLVQAMLLAWWSLRPSHHPYLRALARVCLSTTAVAVLAVMRVTGEVRPYVTTWISMVGTLGALAAVVPLFPRNTIARPAARGLAATGLVAGVALAFALVGRPLVRDSQFPPARAMSDRIVSVLRQRGTRRSQVVIQTGSPELFYAASAVLLQMHKSGVAFAVDRPWLNFFEDRWRPNGIEDDTLDFRMVTPRDDLAIVCSKAEIARLCVGVRARPAS